MMDMDSFPERVWEQNSNGLWSSRMATPEDMDRRKVAITEHNEVLLRRLEEEAEAAAAALVQEAGDE